MIYENVKKEITNKVQEFFQYGKHMDLDNYAINVDNLRKYLKNKKKWGTNNNIKITNIKIVHMQFPNIDEYIPKHSYLVAKINDYDVIIDIYTNIYRNDKSIFIGNIQELKEELKNLLTKNSKDLGECFPFYNILKEMYTEHNVNILKEMNTEYNSWIRTLKTKYTENPDSENSENLEKSVQMLLNAWYAPSESICKIEGIPDEINEYHKLEGFIYAGLDRCLDGFGNLRQQDPEAMAIMDDLWKLIHNSIQNNTLNTSETKETEGIGIDTNSYMHIVLYQKLVDYIKHRDLDKNANKITSNFVSDISNKYGTNAPELEINEMKYRQFCKTLLKKHVEQIIQSKPPSLQIICPSLYSVDNLSDLVANWIIDAGKSIYMPAELKKFYTNETFKTFKKDLKTFKKNFEALKKNFEALKKNFSHNIISQEEQNPDSCLQNINNNKIKKSCSYASI